MTVAYFRSLAARFSRRSQTENDLEEELRSHIQLRADDLERFGLGRADAERRARWLHCVMSSKERRSEELTPKFLVWNSDLSILIIESVISIAREE